MSRRSNVLERLAFLQHAPEITVLLSTADGGRAVEGCLSCDEIAAARLGSLPLSPIDWRLNFDGDSISVSPSVGNWSLGDLVSHGRVRERATVIQQKNSRPVKFEIMTEARKSLDAWLTRREGASRDFAFPSRVDYMGHPQHSAVRPIGRRMGFRCRPRSSGIRHSLALPHEGLVDLQRNRQFESRPNLVGAHEHREHRQVPRRRH